MFFNISKEQNNEFPVHIEYAGLSIDLDNGWTVNDGCIYKGLPGNECTIICRDNAIIIDTHERRTFPIFYNKDAISNIIRYDIEFYKDEELHILENNVTLIKSREPRRFTHLLLADSELVDYLYDYLDKKIKNFNSALPIKFFPTGGVDTAVIISFMMKHKKPYELLTAEYKDMDYFTCHTRPRLGKFWAYQNIHHWRDPSILLSGTNGDEMMLRNPHDAYLIGKIHGENILETLKEAPNKYHSHYYLRKKHKHEYDEVDESNLNLDQARQQIIDRNYFDYQHWHLGNTLTWTPLNDLKIINIMLNFSYAGIRNQLLDASISKQLIERNNPRLLKLVSASKNNLNYHHLHKIFERIESI
jgi:hypothetical protein